MTSRIKQYRACVDTCAATDYASHRSVRLHNAAADRMRAIVVEVNTQGKGAIPELLPLLNEPQSKQWLAFQLLDLCELQSADVERCLAIIREVADGSDSEALGARIWLRNWVAKHA